MKSSYASIDHVMLLDQLAVHIKDRGVLNLLGQHLRRTSERGGAFWDYEKGISLRCPLSPMTGAFFLNALDAAAAKLRLFYVRFMDDILILAPTRWQLRGAVKAVNQMLGALRLEKHPDKTVIGRIERGFDCLGSHFSPAGLAVAKQTVANFIEKASRLSEQERRAAPAATSLEKYVRSWLRWAQGGVWVDGRRPSIVSAHIDIRHLPGSGSPVLGEGFAQERVGTLRVASVRRTVGDNPVSAQPTDSDQ